MPHRQILHQAIRVAVDPLSVMERIVRQALVFLPQADGASLEIRRDQEVLEYLTAAGTLAAHVGLRISVHGSLSGLALLTGDVQMCNDALADPRVDIAAVTSTGIRSMLCVPLSDQPGSIAVLKVTSTRTAAFTKEDAERLRMLTRFLDVTVSAASELATVTADVLTELDRVDASAEGSLDWQQATAQFVADIMTPGLFDRLNLEHCVRSVLADEALDIVFQPIVNLATGSMVACEALSRFRSSDNRSPDWWFAAAQRVGLGVELELLALRRALALMPQVPHDLRIAANVGPDAVLHPEFLRLVKAADVRRLTVELTEHDAVRDYTELLSVLQGLRALGVQLSVDDTGSGYSGLTHILQLHPDVIKLDREMVAGVHADPVRRALATAIVSFAKAIGARVVAEGLEVQAEADCLRELGVSHAQGYLYWRPMPVGDLIIRAT